MGSEQPSRVLGIIGCEVLMDEMAHVIAADQSVTRVIIMDTPESRELAERLKKWAQAKKIEVRPEEEIGKDAQDLGTLVVVKVMPIALHQGPSELRDKVLAEIQKLQRVCNSILVFYGLCGNAFKNIDQLASAFSVPITILRDDKHLIVDDCVGAELGGTEEYLAYLRNEHGEYPLNARWAEKWRHFMHETQLLRDEDDIEEAKMVFKCMGYARLAKLETGLGELVEFESRAKDFASLFELEVAHVQCSLRVVEESYKSATSLLDHHS